MKNPTQHPIKNWMALATTEEQEALALLVPTSRAQLYQYASLHRGTSTPRAIAIERATTKMNKSSKGRLPIINRTELSQACSSCVYAKKCLKEKP